MRVRSRAELTNDFHTLDLRSWVGVVPPTKTKHLGKERSWGREGKYQLSLRHEAIEWPNMQPVVFGGVGLKVGRERVAWLLGAVSTEMVIGALRASRMSKGWCLDEARTGRRTEPLPRELPSLRRKCQLSSLRQLPERRKATGDGQRGVNGRRKVL